MFGMFSICAVGSVVGRALLDNNYCGANNCTLQAKRGELGAIMAKAISDFREFTDLFKNVLIKGMTVAESLKDSKEDQEANKYGREQGKKIPKSK